MTDILTPRDVIEIARAIEAVALERGFGEVRVILRNGKIHAVVTETSVQRDDA